MAGALVQSTSFPSAVSSESEVRSKRSGSIKRAVKMMGLQAPPVRVRTFSGLRGVNALDNLVKRGQDFHSKVAAATSVRRAKPTRIVPKAMFERFTEKAIKVIMLAQEEARRLGHNFVGTEQILLGLIGEGTGIAAKVLKSMGINLKDARVEVEKIIGRGSGFVAVEIPFTPRAKRVLELSLEEARQLGHNYIGSEHLLLGLLREGEGVAARVLENLGADPNNIRTQVDMVIVPATTGQMGILPGHVPTIAELKPGLLSVHEGNDVKKYFISSGFAFVHSNSYADILAVEAVPLDRIDPAQVQKGLSEFTQKLSSASTELDKAEAQIGVDVHSALNFALTG